MLSLARGIIFQVEYLQPRNHALAVVEQLQDLLHLQVGQVQRNAVAGMQGGQSAEYLRSGQPQQFGHVRPVERLIRIDDLRVLGLLQIPVDERLQVHAVQTIDPRVDLTLSFGRCRTQLGLQRGDAPMQRPHQLVVDKLGKMQLGFLPDADKPEKLRFVDRQHSDAEAAVELQAVNGVELLEQADYELLLIARGPLTGRHEVHDRRFGQKAQEGLSIGEPAGYPDELHVLVAEARVILDADAHVDVENPGGLEQLGGETRFDEVVVDDPQPANAFDPGIHDEVGGRLAALGVDVVHMVVEGDLVPFLGHFQQVVLLELAADDAGLAGGGHPEVVGQLQLAPGVAIGPHQVFHDLQEHPGGVFGHRTLGGIDHLQPQRSQSIQPVVHPADFERAQQLGDRISRTQALGFRHLLDAVGMKIRGIQFAAESRAAQNVVDDLDQRVVLPIEQVSWYV